MQRNCRKNSYRFSSAVRSTSGCAIDRCLR